MSLPGSIPREPRPSFPVGLNFGAVGTYGKGLVPEQQAPICAVARHRRRSMTYARNQQSLDSTRKSQLGCLSHRLRLKSRRIKPPPTRASRDPRIRSEQQYYRHMQGLIARRTFIDAESNVNNCHTSSVSLNPSIVNPLWKEEDVICLSRIMASSTEDDLGRPINERRSGMKMADPRKVRSQFSRAFLGNAFF